jgi:hypothetical protein
MKLSQLSAGTSIQAGYRNWFTTCQFLGFSFKYEGPIVASSLKELKAQTGCRNLAQLEALGGLDETGIYAVFADAEGGDTWRSYLWQGAWRVGSSADRLQLAALA